MSADVGVAETKNSRDARLLLSCVVTSLYPDLVLEQQGPVESQLVSCAKSLLSALGAVAGVRRSPEWSRLMMFTGNWLRFKQTFAAWKQQDSTRLFANFREHWMQLLALKQTVMSNQESGHEETQSQWLPNIERQQQEILHRVRQVGGQVRLVFFVLESTCFAANANFIAHLPLLPCCSQAAF